MDMRDLKEFKIWRDSEFGRGIVFAFNKEEISSIHKADSGLTRLELKNGDYFECDKSVDRLKNLFNMGDQS